MSFAYSDVKTGNLKINSALNFETSAINLFLLFVEPMHKIGHKIPCALYMYVPNCIAFVLKQSIMIKKKSLNLFANIKPNLFDKT